MHNLACVCVYERETHSLVGPSTPRVLQTQAHMSRWQLCADTSRRRNEWQGRPRKSSHGKRLRVRTIQAWAQDCSHGQWPEGSGREEQPSPSITMSHSGQGSESLRQRPSHTDTQCFQQQWVNLCDEMMFELLISGVWQKQKSLQYFHSSLHLHPHHYAPVENNTTHFRFSLILTRLIRQMAWRGENMDPNADTEMQENV